MLYEVITFAELIAQGSAGDAEKTRGLGDVATGNLDGTAHQVTFELADHLLQIDPPRRNFDHRLKGHAAGVAEDFPWQLTWFDHLAVVHDADPLDHVAQFSHVPRPVVAHQQIESVAGNLPHVSTESYNFV